MFAKYLTLRWRYFWRKSNQNVGRYVSPHTPSVAQCVECCVCYKSRKFETLFASLTRSTNFFAIFAKIFQPAKALEIFLLSAATAIVTRGNSFPEPLSIAVTLHLSILLNYNISGKITVYYLFCGDKNENPT